MTQVDILRTNVGGFFQKVRFNSKKNYSKSLSWAWNLNKLFTVMGGNFKFPVQDSDLEYFFWRSWDLKNKSHFLIKSNLKSESLILFVFFVTTIWILIVENREDFEFAFCFLVKTCYELLQNLSFDIFFYALIILLKSSHNQLRIRIF